MKKNLPWWHYWKESRSSFINFWGKKARKDTRDKDRYYTMIKGSVLQDVMILNMYAPNNRVTNYMRQNPIKLPRWKRYIHYGNWRLHYPSILNG